MVSKKDLNDGININSGMINHLSEKVEEVDGELSHLLEQCGTANDSLHEELSNTHRDVWDNYQQLLRMVRAICPHKEVWTNPVTTSHMGSSKEKHTRNYHCSACELVLTKKPKGSKVICKTCGK